MSILVRDCHSGIILSAYHVQGSLWIQVNIAVFLNE